MATRIGIIGNGNVGSALERGLKRAGHEVRAVGKDPKGVRDTGGWAEVVILAVPFGAVEESVRELGDTVNGKTLVDVTNALTPDMKWAVGFTTSGAEELQKKAPKANVVKAFNTIFAQHMDKGQVKGQTLTALAAGNDAKAKEQVLSLAKGIGFDAVDAGPLQNARMLEAFGFLNITLGYVQKLGPEIGFKLVR